MPRHVLKYPVFALFLILAMTMQGTETGASVVGNNGEWEGYSEIEDSKQVCFMGSEPLKSTGKYTRRGQVYMLVTHRPVEKSFNVVSITSGYTFKKDSEATIQIGNNTFKLLAVGGHAFTADSQADNALVEAMIRGSSMVIKGVSSRGTQTTDTYSLTGFSATYKAISKACGK